MEKNLLFSLSILLSFLTYSSHTLTHYQNAPNMWEWLGQTQIKTQPRSVTWKSGTQLLSQYPCLSKVTLAGS